MKTQTRFHMKKALTYLAIATISSFLWSACSDYDKPDFKTSEVFPSSIEATSDSHVISQDQDITIANHVLGYPSTKSINPDADIQYVLRESTTRSSENCRDTLAYICNFPNDEGFVIVSADNRVYPVLAFSKESNFSYENKIAKENFIDNIDAYISNANANATTSYSFDADSFDSCYAVNPIIKTSIGQGAPWNKYVEIDNHPGDAAGCVAVATALVMSHTCHKLKYHGVEYPMRSIVEAIQKGQASSSQNSNNSSPQKIVGGYTHDLPTYSYEQAVDSMAKILYWIGKDVGMVYGSQSSANSKRAFDLCKSLNFSIPSGYATYNLTEIVDYLDNNYIVYMRGNNLSSGGGHAWVADGCYFCVDQSNNDKKYNAYIHCDWGWEGSGNGFFTGEVFNLPSRSYAPKNYFAVLRDATL